MNPNPTQGRSFEFCFVDRDYTLVRVEELAGRVTIRATADTFSRRRKIFFIRELASEGFIPDDYQWNSLDDYVGSQFREIRWLVDSSWLKIDEGLNMRNHRLVRRLIIPVTLLWLLMLHLLSLSEAKTVRRGRKPPYLPRSKLPRTYSARHGPARERPPVLVINWRRCHHVLRFTRGGHRLLMALRMTASDAKADILIIDDEVQIRRLLRLTLESAGYHVREAENGALGLNEGAIRRPDVVVLDLSLPDQSGLEVLRRLREWSQVPVLILSVRSDESDKIAVLDAGADDYLTKPFGGGELLARIRVLLRRAQPVGEVSIVRFGAVEVDFSRRVVTRDGAEVKLTAKEYALLRLLLRHRGKVLTHRQILRELWGPKAEEQTHYLRVYMAHLRQKLEEEPNRPKYFKTESGVGYRLVGE